MIEIVDRHIIYENPKPLLRSRHGFFPGIAVLPSGELLALVVIGQAFESVDLRTHVFRSTDVGRTWTEQGPLDDGADDPCPISDFYKPLVRSDGSLLALGYRFHRRDPEQTIAIAETDGALPGDNAVALSRDEGRTWTRPTVIPMRTPELVEIPSRAIELRSGDIVATGGLFRLADGSNPSGQYGALVRSRDGGRTWDDGTRYFDTPGHRVAAYESHIAELSPGRLVAACWAFELGTGRYLNNQATFSHDDGHTWSAPVDTGIAAESVNLMPLGDDELLSIHCHRGRDVGLVVRRVDVRGDRWRTLESEVIWGSGMGSQTHDGQSFREFASSIRFGQGSLTRLPDGDVLAAHWCVADGQGSVLGHRLRVTA